MAGELLRGETMVFTTMNFDDFRIRRLRVVMRPRGVFITSALAMFVFSTVSLLSATYYVDYAGGSDANAGTSSIAPWKHCPGDDAATGVPGGTELGPGDRIKFKGGVSYLGAITAKWNGERGAEIIYDGNTSGDFGEGRAIIDGSDPLTSWARCASSDDARGNSFWANLIYTVIPTNRVETVLSGRLHQNEELLWVAQEPDLSNPFLYDEIEEFYAVPPAAATTTTIVDSARLTGGTAQRWIGASVIVWREPNVVDVREITNFEPSSARITFEELGGVPYTNHDTRYSLFNGVHALDREGEYVMVQEGQNYRIILWPRHGDTNGIRISVRGFGFNTVSRSHLQFRGFAIARQFGQANNGGTAIGRYTGSLWQTNITVANNVIKHTGKPSGALAAIYLFRCSQSAVTNNILWQLSKSRGIFLNTGSENLCQDNYVTNAGRTGITFYNQTNSVLRRNYAVAGGGVHANGMNVYSDSDGVVVSENYISDSNIAFTYSSSHNLTFINNICISTNERCFATFGDITGTNRLYNNLFLESPSRNAVYIRAAYRKLFHFANNILDGSDFGDLPGGESGLNRHDNIFTSIYDDDVAFGPGEVYWIDRNTLFGDARRRDYRIRQGVRGVNMSSLFTHDFSRNQRSRWDIGAFEFDGTNTFNPVSPFNLRMGP